MEPKKIYRAIVEDVPEDNYSIPLGQGKIVKEGTDVTLVSWGAMMPPSLQAAGTLKDRIRVEVIDLRTLSPIDTSTITRSVEKTGRAVVVHEAPRTAGLGAEITAIINEKAFLSLEAPIERVTGFDVPFPLYKLENYYLPNAERIAKAIEKVAKF
jgi:pyruvate dehydrogenase E1 component beta subunit